MKIKNINKLFRLAFFTVSIACLSLLNSCKEPTPGAPVITNVRETDPATTGMDLPSANLGAFLVIQGSNFSGLQNVYFNGLEAYVYSTYVTDNNIIVQVPDTTPTIATDPDNATNILKIVTTHGEVEHDLTILPPPAIIDSISNEFALPGEEIILYGNYYYFVEEVIFPSDSIIVTEGISAAADGKSCKVIVPENVSSGQLYVVSESGISSEKNATLFHDTASLICEFEHPEFSVDGNARIENTTSNPVIPSIKDNYLYFFGTSIPPAMYFQQSLALETQSLNYQEMFTYPDSTMIEDDFSTSKLALEFEIFIFEPWLSGFFEIAFLDGSGVDAWTNAYRTSFYYSDVRSNSVGKWVTIHIPITEFTIDDAGEVLPLAYSNIINKPININFKNPNAEAGGSFIPLLMIAMDNLRIVVLD